MSADLRVRAGDTCLSNCNASTTERITNLADKCNTASSNIQSHLATVGRVFRETQTNFDLGMTTRVLREQLATLEGVEQEIVKEQEALKEQTSYCGMKTENVVKGLHRVVEPLTWVAGFATLASEIFKDTANQSSTTKGIGLGLCATGAGVSRLKDNLRVKLYIYDCNKRDLQLLQQASSKTRENSEAMVTVLEHLDGLIKKGQNCTNKEWRRLFYSSTHMIPKEYRQLIDPKEFRNFVKIQSPRMRFRSIAAQVMQQQREDLKNPTPSNRDVAIDMKEPLVEWHND